MPTAAEVAAYLGISEGVLRRLKSPRPLTEGRAESAGADARLALLAPVLLGAAEALLAWDGLDLPALGAAVGELRGVVELIENGPPAAAQGEESYEA